VSRKTPQEIADAADRRAISGGERLIYASRMSAKVDSAAVQDGFDIYHHAFFFSPTGAWCVVQQGMNEQSGWARRYHWLGECVDDFVCEPHAAIQDLADADSGDASPPAQSHESDAKRQQMLLNMVAWEADDNRRASADLVREKPDWLLGEVERITEGPTLFAPARHPVLNVDINMKRLKKLVVEAHEQDPKDFETLLGLPGVGPAAVRSLSLLAEIIFHAPPSHRDPTAPPPNPHGEPNAEVHRWADYSYAHGGKDGTPYPVDRAAYDRNIAALSDAVRRARVGENDKFNALRRLARLGP
jgi:hypothetical protein